MEYLQKVCYNEVCQKQVAYEMSWNNFIQKEKEYKNLESVVICCLYFDLIKSHLKKKKSLNNPFTPLYIVFSD